MKIKLGDVDFQVEQVAAPVRAAILDDPVLQQVVWRDVYRWDHSAQKGEVLVPVSDKGAVPIPNAVAVFVGREASDGSLAKAEGPSKKMTERVLKAVGGKSINDLSRALHRLLNTPQKTIPLEAFAPMNGAASYTIRMHTEFGVVALRNAGRNLALHAIVPGHLVFHAEVGSTDAKGWAALDDGIKAAMPAFVVPPQSKANLNLRLVALARRLEEMQAELKAQGDAADEGLRRVFALAVGEWKTLTKKRTAAA